MENRKHSELINRIEKLIGLHQIENALKELLQANFNDDIRYQVISLQARFNENKKKNSLGTIDNQIYQQNNAQIIIGLLQLTSLIKENSTEENNTKIVSNQVVRAEDFFHPLPDMDDYIRRSKEMDISGVTLAVFMEKGFNLLKTAIVNGANVRILVLQNKLEAFQFASVRSEDMSPSEFKDKHTFALNNIKKLLRDTHCNPSAKGSLKVRMSSYPPSYGIEVFDTIGSNPKNGKIKIELYPHHKGRIDGPIFTIEKDKDLKWYNYFRNQFEEIWKRGKKYELKI